MALLLSFAALFVGQPSASETIEYGYVAQSRGILAGIATVRVRREQDHYEIHGEAKATGLFKLFSNWRSWFRVAGQMESDMPLLTAYEHMESNRSRVKEVKVVDGTVHYVRNGEQRAPADAPAAIDVFSLIFVYGKCDETFRAHSGRMGFEISLTEREMDTERETCLYSVTDDEGKRFTAKVVLGEFKGFHAPTELDFEGYELGRFLLQDVKTYGSEKHENRLDSN